MENEEFKRFLNDNKERWDLYFFGVASVWNTNDMFWTDFDERESIFEAEKKHRIILVPYEVVEISVKRLSQEEIFYLMTTSN